MTVFAGAVDATFAAFGVDTVYTPTRGKGSTELQSLDVEDAQRLLDGAMKVMMEAIPRSVTPCGG
jgi:hypothetical protein